MAKVSNCCGERMNNMWLDYEMCPGCHEHCGIEEEEVEIEEIPLFKGTMENLNNLKIR